MPLGEGLSIDSRSAEITDLLKAWGSGDQAALDQLLPVVYDELRRLARSYLRRERPDHTLQATALVHEAYLRLIDQHSVTWQNRAHFFGVSAQLMRQILVQYARRRNAVKRDGGYRLTLDDQVMALAENRSVDLVALDDALNGLAELDPQQSRIVELRFFGGLSIEETSQVMDISPATVKRHWATARVWLHAQINRAECHEA